VNVSSTVIAGQAAPVLLDASIGAELRVVAYRGHGALSEMLPDSRAYPG
jgi:hypothetical protein